MESIPEQPSPDRKPRSLQRSKHSSSRRQNNSVSSDRARNHQHQLSVSTKPQFSFGKQLNLLSPTVEENKAAREDDDGEAEEEDKDWLVRSEKNIQQDLDMSKKELELVRGVLQDLDVVLGGEKKPSRQLRDQKLLMGACLEYSSSRCQLLKERLRQVQFWSNSRQMGRKIPDAAPEEWRMADIEWRKWLSEQAAMRTDKVEPSVLEQTADPENDVAWRIFGPLPHILAACTGLEDM
ncbi:hypothetical protein F4778DRAFT_477217 [Xylariomycetidae sp. FL2044]|nr:hypothetical protein F4778DRAFT_477217 [Xylariomycetidae sp. FL2044]